MAEKGKIIVISDGSGGIIEDPRTKVKYTFTQPNHKELCLNMGDKVKFDIVTCKDGSQAAVNVERITAGTIMSLDGLGGGTIEERQSLKKVTFFQPLTSETGIEVGDIVRYSLIATPKGELAVNLNEVIE